MPAPGKLYQAKRTDQNLVAYMQYKKEANAVWSATQNRDRSPHEHAENPLGIKAMPSFDQMSTIQPSQPDKPTAVSFISENLRVTGASKGPQLKITASERCSDSDEFDDAQLRVRRNVDQLLDNIRRDIEPPLSTIQDYLHQSERARKRKILRASEHGLCDDPDEEFFALGGQASEKQEVIDEHGYEEEDEEVAHGLLQMTRPRSMFTKAYVSKRIF